MHHSRLISAKKWFAEYRGDWLSADITLLGKIVCGFLPPTDDQILAKYHHCAKVMIGKIKKHIIYCTEDKMLRIDKEDMWDQYYR